MSVSEHSLLQELYQSGNAGKRGDPFRILIGSEIPGTQRYQCKKDVRQLLKANKGNSDQRERSMQCEVIIA